MQEHQKRVIAEYDDLFTRTTALNRFFGTEVFTALDEAERDRLRRQWEHMQLYGQVLAERINAFS